MSIASEYQRIHVMGPSGSGKTTFAASIAARLALPHTELDAIHWRPNWQLPAREEFRAQVAELAAGEAWVVDGNYGKARDLLWQRVQAVLFLDYPLSLCLWRLTRRTFRRIVHRERLWSGNRQTVREAFFSRDSLILYTIRTYARRRRQIHAERRDSENSHIHFEFFKDPSQAESWLEALPQTKDAVS